MKTTVIFLLAVLLLVAVAFISYINSGPTADDFSYLKQPRLTDKADEKVLVIELTGDPNVVAKDAFTALFKTYFQSGGSGSHMPSPKARWGNILSSPKSKWIGQYSLPAPVTEIPAGKGDPRVKLTTWQYGQVAEILNVGPYSKEAPKIEELLLFIKEKGFEVVGDHEEEYIRGPKMFGLGDPQKYLTIIRYRVKTKKH